MANWSGLRPVGAAHIVQYGLALLIDKAGEQLLRVPKTSAQARIRADVSSALRPGMNGDA